MKQQIWIGMLAAGAMLLASCGVLKDDIFPSDVQGKWGVIYDDKSIEDVCSDEDGLGIWMISSDEMSGYETSIKGLNVSQEVGMQLGRQWQVQVSASSEGELIPGVMTFTLADDGELDLLFPEWADESWKLQRCDSKSRNINASENQSDGIVDEPVNPILKGQNSSMSEKDKLKLSIKACEKELDSISYISSMNYRTEQMEPRKVLHYQYHTQQKRWTRYGDNYVHSYMTWRVRNNALTGGVKFKLCIVSKKTLDVLNLVDTDIVA